MYVSMSCATAWENIEIWLFNLGAIKVGNEILVELNKLQQKFAYLLHN